MPRIFIDSGHFYKNGLEQDPGAVIAGYTERDICMKIRDELKKILPDAIFVPDEFNLSQTIEWINGFCSNNDLLIAIHLNSNANVLKSGCEAYYSDVSYLSDIFSKNVSKSLGVANLGSIHDSRTYVGSLGWLRKTKGQAVLIEVCYLSNLEDRRKLLMPGGYRKVAEGILAGINEHKANLSMLEYLKQLISKLLILIK